MLSPEEIKKIVNDVLDSDCAEIENEDNLLIGVTRLCGLVVKATEQAILSKLQFTDDKLVEICCDLAWCNAKEENDCEIEPSECVIVQEILKTLSSYFSQIKDKELERIIKLLSVNTCNENPAEECERRDRDHSCEPCWRQALKEG